MKEKYEKLELEVIEFTTEDIITTSGGGDDDWGPIDGPIDDNP